MILNPKKAPITGSGHILLQYEPQLHIEKGFDYLHMKNMNFYQHNKKIELNKEHHQPIFIAQGVDELRANRNTRKVLKEFKIFEKCPDDDEEYQ